jgi:hypothetical protein
MSSVRAALDPLNTALGRQPNYWIPASFSGLPIINQKLAALHPLGGGAFFITLQGLMEVVQSTRPGEVVAALAQANQPAPPNQPANPPHGPPNPPPPSPAQPTIGYQFDGSDAGDSAANDYNIAGSGFAANEKVDIIDSSTATAIAAVPANGLGQYSIILAFNAGTSLKLFARGEDSRRVSNTISFVA